MRKIRHFSPNFDVFQSMFIHEQSKSTAIATPKYIGWYPQLTNATILKTDVINDNIWCKVPFIIYGRGWAGDFGFPTLPKIIAP